MVEIKEIHPYDGHDDWILHYAEDENGTRYLMEQIETGIEYGVAVDIYPCPYTYRATDKKDEDINI